jgi:hypothetical protein
MEVRLALARRTWLFTLCLWLSLATVLGHALAPIGSPLTQKSGSAFSAATWDVSLGPARAGVNAKLKRAQANAGEDESGPPDLPAPVLLASAPVLPRPATGAAPFPASAASAPALSGADGHFNARAPPRA